MPEAARHSTKTNSKGRTLKAGSGKFALKGSSARLVLGRNALTGKTILAPLSYAKVSKTFKDHKTKVVSEVKYREGKDRGGKDPEPKGHKVSVAEMMGRKGDHQR